MVDLRVKCDRCNGAGIYYIAVLNGYGVPAHPDNGICWKCHGAKYITPNLPEGMTECISRFLEKHELTFTRIIDIYKDYVLVYTDKYIVKFNKFDSSAFVKKN